MTSWEEKVLMLQRENATITINNTNTDTVLGRACAICEGQIPITDWHPICERCRRKLKAFVEAED